MNGGRFENWLRCPCCARRAEYVVTTTRRRAASALAAAGLAALAGLCLSGGPSTSARAVGTGQVALIATAVAAAGAFAVLQVIARSHHRRPPTFADWRRWPPGYDPESGSCHADQPGTSQQP
jgi:ABC-type amino acid transport substrate-binding protein